MNKSADSPQGTHTQQQTQEEAQHQECIQYSIQQTNINNQEKLTNIQVKTNANNFQQQYVVERSSSNVFVSDEVTESGDTEVSKSCNAKLGDCNGAVGAVNSQDSLKLIEAEKCVEVVENINIGKVTDNTKVNCISNVIFNTNNSNDVDTKTTSFSASLGEIINSKPCHNSGNLNANPEIFLDKKITQDLLTKELSNEDYEASDSDTKSEDCFDELDEDFEEDFEELSNDHSDDGLGLSFDNIENPTVESVDSSAVPRNTLDEENVVLLAEGKSFQGQTSEFSKQTVTKKKPSNNLHKVAFSDNITVHEVCTSSSVEGLATLAQSEDLYDSELEESVISDDGLFDTDYIEESRINSDTAQLFPYHDPDDIFEQSGSNFREWIDSYEKESNDLKIAAVLRRLDQNPVLVADIVAHRLSSSRSFSHCSDESLTSSEGNGDDDVFDDIDNHELNAAKSSVTVLKLNNCDNTQKYNDTVLETKKHEVVNDLPSKGRKLTTDINQFSYKLNDTLDTCVAGSDSNKNYLELEYLKNPPQKNKQNREIENTNSDQTLGTSIIINQSPVYLHKRGEDKEVIKSFNLQKTFEINKNYNTSIASENKNRDSSIKYCLNNSGAINTSDLKKIDSPKQQILSTRFIESNQLQSTAVEKDNIQSKLDTQKDDDKNIRKGVPLEEEYKFKKNLRSASIDLDLDNKNNVVTSTFDGDNHIHTYSSISSSQFSTLKTERSGNDLCSKLLPRTVIAGDCVHLRNNQRNIRENIHKSGYNSKLKVSNNEKVVIDTPSESELARNVAAVAGGGISTDTGSKNILEKYKLDYIFMEGEDLQSEGSKQDYDVIMEQGYTEDDSSNKKESSEELSANEDFEVIEFNNDNESSIAETVEANQIKVESMNSSDNSSEGFEIVDLETEPGRRLQNKGNNSAIYQNLKSKQSNLTGDQSHLTGESYTETNIDENMSKQANVSEIPAEKETSFLPSGLISVKGDYSPPQVENVKSLEKAHFSHTIDNDEVWVDITETGLLQDDSNNKKIIEDVKDRKRFNNMDEIKAESLQKISLVEIEDLDEDDLHEPTPASLLNADIVKAPLQCDDISDAYHDLEDIDNNRNETDFKLDIAIAKDIVSQVYSNKIGITENYEEHVSEPTPVKSVKNVNSCTLSVSDCCFDVQKDDIDTTDEEVDSIMSSKNPDKKTNVNKKTNDLEQHMKIEVKKEIFKKTSAMTSNDVNLNNEKVEKTVTKDNRDGNEMNEEDDYTRGRKRHRRTVKEVKEAVRKLRGEGTTKERPHSYHGDAGSGTEVRSRSGSQRRYDWNTTHFFPDFHDSGTGYNRRGSGNSNFSEGLDENWLQDIQNYCINIDSKTGPGNQEIKPETETVPIEVFHETAMETSCGLREKENLPPHNGKNNDDGDYASSSEGDRDSPKTWSKSPLHHNKKKRKERTTPTEINGIGTPPKSPLGNTKDTPVGAIPISRTGLKLGSPGIQRVNRRKATPNMGTKVSPKKQSNSEDIQDKYDKFAELQRRRRALESTSEEDLVTLQYNSIQDSLRRYDKHKHPKHEKKTSNAQRKLFQSEQTLTEETTTSSPNFIHKAFSENVVSQENGNHTFNRPPPLPSHPPPMVTPPPVRSTNDFNRSSRSESKEKEFSRSSSSRSRGSKDEGTNDFLMEMKKRLKNVQHKSQEDVTYEEKPTDRKKMKSEIIVDHQVSVLNSGVKLFPKSQTPPVTQTPMKPTYNPLNTADPRHPHDKHNNGTAKNNSHQLRHPHLSRSFENMRDENPQFSGYSQERATSVKSHDADSRWSQDEVFVDEIYDDGRYGNPNTKQRSSSMESRQTPTSQASEGSASRKLDAKTLVLEERKKFEEYKRPHIPPDDYEYILRKIHHKQSSEHDQNSPRQDKNVLTKELSKIAAEKEGQPEKKSQGEYEGSYWLESDSYLEKQKQKLYDKQSAAKPHQVPISPTEKYMQAASNFSFNDHDGDKNAGIFHSRSMSSINTKEGGDYSKKQDVQSQDHNQSRMREANVGILRNHGPRDHIGGRNDPQRQSWGYFDQRKPQSYTTAAVHPADANRVLGGYSSHPNDPTSFVEQQHNFPESSNKHSGGTKRLPEFRDRAELLKSWSETHISVDNKRTETPGSYSGHEQYDHKPEQYHPPAVDKLVSYEGTHYHGWDYDSMHRPDPKKKHLQQQQPPPAHDFSQRDYKDSHDYTDPRFHENENYPRCRDPNYGGRNEHPSDYHATPDDPRNMHPRYDPSMTNVRPVYVYDDYAHLKPPVPKAEAVPKEPKYWQANSLYQSYTPPLQSPHSSTYSAPAHGKQQLPNEKQPHAGVHNPYYNHLPPYGSLDNVHNQRVPPVNQHDYKNNYQSPQALLSDQYPGNYSSHSLDQHGRPYYNNDDNRSHDSSFDKGSERMFQLEITPKKPPRTQMTDGKEKGPFNDRDRYIREYVPSEKEQAMYFQPIHSDQKQENRPVGHTFKNYHPTNDSQNRVPPYVSASQLPNYSSAVGQPEYRSASTDTPYLPVDQNSTHFPSNQHPNYRASANSQAYQPQQYSNNYPQYSPSNQIPPYNSNNQHPQYIPSNQPPPQYMSTHEHSQCNPSSDYIQDTSQHLPYTSSNQHQHYTSVNQRPEYVPDNQYVSNTQPHQALQPNQYPSNQVQYYPNEHDTYKQQTLATEKPVYSQIPIKRTETYNTNQEPVISEERYKPTESGETYTQIFPPPPNEDNTMFEFSPEDQEKFSREVTEKLHILGETDSRFRDYEEKVTKYIQEQKKKNKRVQSDTAEMVPKNMLDQSVASNQYEAYIREGRSRYRAQRSQGEDDEDYVDLKTIRERKEVFDDIRCRKEQRSRSLPRDPSTRERDVSPRRYPPPSDQKNRSSSSSSRGRESSPHKFLPVVPDARRPGAQDSETMKSPTQSQNLQTKESSIQKYYRLKMEQEQKSEQVNGPTENNRAISLGSWRSEEEPSSNEGFQRAAKQTQSFRYSPEKKYSSKDFEPSSSKPKKYEVRTESVPTKYVLRPSKSAENLEKLTEDLEKVSLNDIKERLFGPNQTQLKPPVFTRNTEVTEEKPKVKLENVKAYFNQAVSAPSFGRIPVHNKSSSSTRDQEKDELLFSYASFRDTPHTKQLNIFDDLTDLEVTYQKLNSTDENGQEYLIISPNGENSIKRLSISNVRKFEEMLEKRAQQQDLNWTKEWVSKKKKSPSIKSGDQVLCDRVSPVRSMPQYSAQIEDTGNVTPNDGTKSSNLSLPKKKADDMAFRKTHQPQKPLASASMPLFNYSAGTSPNVTPSPSVDNMQQQWKRQKSRSPDRISEDLSKQGYQKTTHYNISTTAESVGRRSRFKSAPDRDHGGQSHDNKVKLTTTTPLYTPKKTTTEVTVSIKKRSQSLDRSKVGDQRSCPALQRSSSNERNIEASLALNNKPVDKGIASVINRLTSSSQHELTASAPDLSAKVPGIVNKQSTSVFSGSYNVDGDFVSEDPKYKHAIKPKKSFTPRELKLRNELKLKLKSGRSGDSGFQESDQSDSSDQYHRLPPDGGVCDSDELDGVKICDTDKSSNSFGAYNIRSNINVKHVVNTDNSNNNNSGSSSRSSSKTPPLPAFIMESSVRSTPRSVRISNIESSIREGEHERTGTDVRTKLHESNNDITYKDKTMHPAVRPSHMDFNKIKRKQFFQELSQRKLMSPKEASNVSALNYIQKEKHDHNDISDGHFATQISQLKYIDDVIDSAIITQSPPIVAQVVQIPYKPEESIEDSSPSSLDDLDKPARKLSKDMLRRCDNSSDVDYNNMFSSERQKVDVTLVKPHPYPFSSPFSSPSKKWEVPLNSGNQEVIQHEAKHGVEFMANKLKAPPCDEVGSQLDRDLQIARERLTAKLAPHVSGLLAKDTHGRKFEETNLDDIDDFKVPNTGISISPGETPTHVPAHTTVISSHSPQQHGTSPRYSWSETNSSSSKRKLSHGEEATMVDRLAEGYEVEDKGYRRQVNREETKIIKRRTQIQREFIHPSVKDNSNISQFIKDDKLIFSPNTSTYSSGVETSIKKHHTTMSSFHFAETGQDMSDGEMTDATDITLDSMVRANIGCSVAIHDSPVTTDSSETTSENSQKEYIVSHGVKRRPKTVKLINPSSQPSNQSKASLHHSDQSQSTLQKAQNPSLSSPVHYSEFSDQQHYDVQIVPSESTSHHTSYYKSETSTRHVDQSETSKQFSEYEIQEGSSHSESYRRQNKKAMRNDERRLSLKERVQLFEDQAAPFLSKGPRVNEDRGDPV